MAKRLKIKELEERIAPSAMSGSDDGGRADSSSTSSGGNSSGYVAGGPACDTSLEDANGDGMYTAEDGAASEGDSDAHSRDR